MALTDITFVDKEDRITSPYARKNIVIADDVNQLKAAINIINDTLRACVTVLTLSVAFADMSGDTYQHAKLIGRTPITGFLVITNDGSGTVLNEGAGKGFTFNSGTGTLTMPQGNYIIQILVPIT